MEIKNSANWFKWIAVIAVIAALALGLNVAGIEWRDITPESLRSLVAQAGFWAPVVYLVVYGQPLLPMSITIMTLAAGITFGPVLGLILALGGSVLRACSIFMLARWLGRDTAMRLFKGRVAKIDSHVGRNGFETVFWVRLIPNFPMDIQNVAFGVSKVKFLPYVLATAIGLFPICFIYAYLGDSLMQPGQIWKTAAVVVSVLILLIGCRFYFAKYRGISALNAEETL